MDDETARELTMLRRVWKAMGCASNPDDFKPTVRDVMWGQVLDYIKRHAVADSRLHRENIELLAELRAAEARIECARCGEKMIRQDGNNTPSNTAMEVCSRCCFQIFDRLTKAAEARAAEAEAVIAEAPHSSFCAAGYGFAEPCDFWKSCYRAGVDQ